jgi:hypothetical protein
MITRLTYGSSFDLLIITTCGSFTYNMRRCDLQDAVDYAEKILDDETPIRCDTVSMITIYDSKTGEICAECTHDPSDVKPFENINYNLDELS